MIPEIRPARPGDLPQIRTCAEQAFAPYIARMGQRPAPMDADYAAAIQSGHTHVATDGETLLGFLIFTPTSHGTLLDTVAVSPNARGKGIGKALIAFCETSARAAGAAKVTLYTNAAMTENLSLYPALGYRETHRATENGFHRVYFEKPLP